MVMAAATESNAPTAPTSSSASSWEELLRKMLPQGAPLLQEDQLDYSISFDYAGPPFYWPPSNHRIPKTRFTTFPKRPPSLNRMSSSFIKSRSSFDSLNSENKLNSGSSIAFDLVTDGVIIDSGEKVVGGDDDDDDDGDRAEDDSPRANEGEKEMKRWGVWFSCGRIEGKGCRRCGKRGLFGNRVVCLVCSVEYCEKCVLKGMGSMPEGRKCIGCIGKPIDEMYRGRLGKGTRVLARVWSPSQVKQIMLKEKQCKANQVRPEQVILNGRELKKEELEELLDCPLPPRNLKPGRYWYDKDSGLWGKEGAKPDKIITSKLGVGGKLQAGASCGNTKVYMNGREITKFELRVLKLAKVECPRATRFWLYEDGSYEEEGQNNIKGHIWEKASTRLLCSLFSMPVPPETLHCERGETASITAGKVNEDSEKHNAKKILLLGLGDSGASTIFKQAKFIQANKLTAEELQSFKLIIQCNTIRYVCTLFKGLECEEEALLKRISTCLAARTYVPGATECDRSKQCISLGQEINSVNDWLFDLSAAGDINTFLPDFPHEYALVISAIWKDPAIQEIYKTMIELQFIPHVAKYFLDQTMEILSNEYEPSENDILLAEGITTCNGLACVEFTLEGCSAISEIYNQPHLSRYQLLLLNSDGFKWLEMFEGMSAVAFCVSMRDYDEPWNHATGGAQNKMLASRDYFLNVVQSSCFGDIPFLLLFTNLDILEEKVDQVPLTVCEWFRDFNPYPLKSHSSSKNGSSLAQKAFHYIAQKFKDLYSLSTGGKRKLYVYPIRGHEQGSVGDAFRYLREILIWEAVVKRDGGGGIYTMSEEEEEEDDGDDDDEDNADSTSNTERRSCNSTLR